MVPRTNVVVVLRFDLLFEKHDFYEAGPLLCSEIDIWNGVFCVRGFLFKRVTLSAN